MIEKITHHLPYLRRHARALFGTQELGDRQVLNLLDHLLSNENPAIEPLKSRQDLFKAFAAYADLNSTNTAPFQNSQQSDKHFSRLSPMPRQAFLLNTIEGFSIMEIAEILELQREDVEGLIGKAERDIARQVKTSVLIIEDEALIAMDLEEMVEELGHEVIGIARTRNETLKHIDMSQPGLVLADVQLADGSSGIDAVGDILQRFDVPVIFITAFPERLLVGDKPEPAFLISKPFKQSHLKGLISQALLFAKDK